MQIRAVSPPSPVIRVLHLVPRLIHGGVARVVEDLMSAADEGRYESFVACSISDYPVDKLHITIAPLFPSTPANAVRSYFELGRLLKKLDIDIVHSHHRFTSVIGRAVAKASGRLFTSTVHDLAGGRASLTRLGVGERVMVFSEAVEEHLVNRLGVSREKVQRIPMGIASGGEPLAERRAEIRRSFGTSGDASVITFTGRFEIEKGPDILLDAAPGILGRVPAAVFWFIGSGTMAEELRAKADALRIGDRVRFVRWREDVSDVVGSADLVVIPSRSEGFGRAALEAMAVRRPVIAAATGGISSLIDHEVSGILVPPDDPLAISEAAVRLLLDRSFAERIATRGYESTVGRNTIAAMAESTTRVYDLLIADASRT